MRREPRPVSGQSRPVQLHRVDKGQGIGNALESAAYQLQIEPGARQPGRQIGQQSAADAACLLDVQHTAAQQAQADEQQRRRQVQQHRPQHPHRYRQSQGNGRQAADCHLHRRHRQQRQHIAEDEVSGGKGRGVQPLQKGALPVTGHQSGGEQGHKRQTEHGDARGQAVDLKQAYGDVGLDGAEQKQQHQGKAQAEAQRQRIPHQLQRGAAAKCAQLHLPASLTMAINASSNLSQPAWRFSSSGVPRASSRPSFIMPTRSDRASASSR